MLDVIHVEVKVVGDPYPLIEAGNFSCDVILIIFKGKVGIKNGVRKVNVDTDNRLAMTGAVRKVLVCEPWKFNLREWMGPARDAMQAIAENRFGAFGSAGHNDDYEPITLEDMKAIHAQAA